MKLMQAGLALKKTVLVLLMLSVLSVLLLKLSRSRRGPLGRLTAGLRFMHHEPHRKAVGSLAAVWGVGVGLRPGGAREAQRNTNPGPSQQDGR